MNNEINMLVQKFSSEIQELFTNVREIIIECTSKKVEENYGQEYQVIMLLIIL